MRSFYQNPIFGVQTASSLRQTHELVWGASPPSSLDGFPPKSGFEKNFSKGWVPASCPPSNVSRPKSGPKLSRALGMGNLGPDLGRLVGSRLLYFMLRNSASGPELGLPGRIFAALLPGKHRNRSSGRPSAGRRADFGAFPVAVRLKSGPEVRSSVRKHYCIT